MGRSLTDDDLTGSEGTDVGRAALESDTESTLDDVSPEFRRLFAGSQRKKSPLVRRVDRLELAARDRGESVDGRIAHLERLVESQAGTIAAQEDQQSRLTGALVNIQGRLLALEKAQQ